MVLMVGYAERGATQMTGELGEMDRLEQRAEDAIANGDPEGAALSVGKAALMAKILAQKEEHQQTRSLFQAAETLFRGQEQGFRAFALFERAGGQPPASKGVCQYLAQADEKVKEAQEELRALPDFTIESLRNRRSRHIGKTQEWERLLQGLEQDLSC
jgi:predicted Zn-dependent protease